MPEIPQDLKKWMGRIEAAKWYRKTYGNTKDRWEKNVKALASDFGTAEKHPSGEAIDVNVTHGTTQLRLAPLYTSDIFITVNPTRKTINIGGRDVDNVARARFTEAEVNYWFNELEVRRRVMRPCARDAESTNHAYAYIGYVRPSDKGLIENPEFKHGRFETNPLIKVGQPFIRRLSPRQVLVPPGAVEFDDHPYIAIEWRRPLEIVKKQYPDTTKDLTPTVDILNIDDVQAGEKSNDFLLDHLRTEDAKLVQIYQIWDQWTGQLYTMAEDHKQWLEDPADWPYRTEGFPVSHMSFVDVPDEYWGTPNMQTYMPQQHELNEARTASKVRNNRLKSVVFMRSDIEEEIGAEYANAPDGKVIKVPLTAGEDIRSAILIDPGLPAPDAAYADGQVQLNDILFTTGLGAQQRQAGDPNIVTATESANVEKWAIIRSTDVGDQGRSFYIDTARKLWMILRQHPNERRERMVLGATGAATLRVRYTLAELEGEFAWKLDIGSLLGDSPVRRQQLALGNYNLLRQDPEVNPVQLISDVVDSQGKANPERYLSKLRNPDEELRIMMQRMPVEPNMRDDHVGHMERHKIQIDSLGAALDQMNPSGPDGEGLRATMLLLMAHMNAQAQMLQAITGQPAPGSAVDENQLRSSVSGETAGEQAGQPLDRSGQGGAAANAAGITGIAGR